MFVVFHTWWVGVRGTNTPKTFTKVKCFKKCNKTLTFITLSRIFTAHRVPTQNCPVLF